MLLNTRGKEFNLENITNEVFNSLYTVDVSAYTEKKNGLTYLSWPFSWAEVKKRYPSAHYIVKRYGELNLPYIFDPKTGYMVFTEITIEGTTHEMWLPVMDGANKAMKSEPYTYKTKFGEKTVDAADMFDINKTIMRCLVKNLAMFGLGLYIYAGEDLPEKETAVISEIESIIAEIDKTAKSLPSKGVEKAKIGETIKSACGTPNYKKITDIAVAKKVLEELKKLGGNN